MKIEQKIGGEGGNKRNTRYIALSVSFYLLAFQKKNNVFIEIEKLIDQHPGSFNTI